MACSFLNKKEAYLTEAQNILLKYLADNPKDTRGSMKSNVTSLLAKMRYHVILCSKIISIGSLL